MIFPPPHFKFLYSNESLDFCDKNKRSKGLTMHIYFHSILWSYLPSVPTILTTCVCLSVCVCVYIYIYIYIYVYICVCVFYFWNIYILILFLKTMGIIN